MSFDLDKITAKPFVELLNLGKKTDLLNLAKHYKLPEINLQCINMKLRTFWYNILLMRRYSMKMLFP